jgi:hypothetical protein
MNIHRSDDTPRLILSIDGGGVRGYLSIQVLKKIELIAKTVSKNPNAVLADFFDFVGGTSIGSLIAVCISLGWPVAKIESLFEEFATALFKTKTGNPLRLVGDTKTLEKILQSVLGRETTLGSQTLKTLVMLMLQNVTTASAWPVTNNTAAKFNDINQGDSNLRLPLWKLVRASTAAPMFFAPVEIEFEKKTHRFVDGGLTSFNNPAFKMLQMTTIPAYNLGWKTGQDNLLLVSVGTGLYYPKPPKTTFIKRITKNILDSKDAFLSLIYTSVVEQDLSCRMVSKVLEGNSIDAEVGNPLRLEACMANEPVCSYARYSVELNKKGHESLGVSFDETIDFRLDKTPCMPKCKELGLALGEKSVRSEHLEPFFRRKMSS